MKDALFNPAKVQKLSHEIKEVYPSFEKEQFETEVLEKFPDLELKERMYHIRDRLYKHLPKEFSQAVAIILKALPNELDNSEKDDDFGDFIYAPHSEYVSFYGCDRENLDLSLDALKDITKRFSVEFAIRDFINCFPKETLKMLEECSLSENYHQRRLASEGLRPKLPWAKKIGIDYKDVVFILENLYSDKCRFVTRSVANHLNDISKLDAPLVLQILKNWQKSKKQANKEMQYIINHSLRTLVKDGDKDALEFLGYRQNPNIIVKDFLLDNHEVNIGEKLSFSYVLKAMSDEELIIDYIVYFLTKSGKLNPKVHKLKKLSIQKDEIINITKKHHFKANMSTRKFYKGEHRLELQINGKIYSSATFLLL